jgi:hypothetical protein
MVRALPVKVPVTSVTRPNDGNEPVYLVGISPAARAIDANRTLTNVTAIALLDILSSLVKVRQTISQPRSKNINHTSNNAPHDGA